MTMRSPADAGTGAAAVFASSHFSLAIPLSDESSRADSKCKNTGTRG